MDGYDVLVKKLRKKAAPRTNFEPSSIFHFPLFSHVAEQARKIASTHPGPYLNRVSTTEELLLDHKLLQKDLHILREGYNTLQQLSPQSGELKEMSDTLTDQENVAAQREAQVDALNFNVKKLAKLYTREKNKQSTKNSYKSQTSMLASNTAKVVYLEHLRDDFGHDTNDLSSDLAKI